MQTRAMLQAAVTIPLALACASCGTGKVRLAPLPVELTKCADEPVAPDLPSREGFQLELVQAERDRLTLDYILALRSAWGDCKAKVDGAKAWNKSLGRQ